MRHAMKTSSSNGQIGTRDDDARQEETPFYLEPKLTKVISQCQDYKSVASARADC